MQTISRTKGPDHDLTSIYTRSVGAGKDKTERRIRQKGGRDNEEEKEMTVIVTVRMQGDLTYNLSLSVSSILYISTQFCIREPLKAHCWTHPEGSLHLQQLWSLISFHSHYSCVIHNSLPHAHYGNARRSFKRCLALPILPPYRMHRR
jgi:hypothetical protein